MSTHEAVKRVSTKAGEASGSDRVAAPSRPAVHKTVRKRSQHAEALNYFVQIATVLELAVTQQTLLLGDISASGYRALKNKADLVMKRDMADRVAYVIRIFQEAGKVYGDPARWLRGEHRAPTFQGTSPLDHMLRGGLSDLIETYEYLHNLDGGWG